MSCCNVHLILELPVGGFVLVDGADDVVAGVDVFVFEETLCMRENSRRAAGSFI